MTALTCFKAYDIRGITPTTLHEGVAEALGLARDHQAGDHVGVHARAADVLAQIAHHQDVDRVKGDGRQHLLGLDQQLLLLLQPDLRVLQRGDEGRLVVRVCHHAECARQVAVRFVDPRGGGQVLLEIGATARVHHGRAVLLAQADDRHLGRPALQV